MANEKRLGIYFGLNGLNIVETLSRKISGQYFMSFTAGEEAAAAAGNVSNEIKLTAALQKALRDNKIDLQDAWVSLPTKDFIVRTFTMPFLPKEEAVPAVEFEVRKYIPFKLEDLIFDHQTSTIMEGKAKKSKILFVGIKRLILERYIYILQQAELKVSFLEPHVFSLMRLFLARKFFSLNQSVVLIENDSNEGTIMVVEQGIPQLIREFRFSEAPTNSFTSEADAEFSRLLNEIRISIEYYRRQNPRGSVTRLIFSSGGELKKSAEDVGRELRIPAFHYTPAETLEAKDVAEYGALAAYGAGLAEVVKTPIVLDLAKKRFHPEAKITRDLLKEAFPVKEILKHGAIAVGLIVLLSSFGLIKISNLQAELSRLKRADAQVSNLSEQELKTMISSYEKKISIIKEVAVNSPVSPRIYSVPMLLPEGVWLSALLIKFDTQDSGSITLRGVSFSPDANVELNLINKFILNLKQSEEIGKNFKRISLVSATSNQMPEQGGTNFEIICR
jgi:Tfp pilus assembly PilM family ATPase